jgi:hypothetical protein
MVTMMMIWHEDNHEEEEEVNEDNDNKAEGDSGDENVKVMTTVKTINTRAEYLLHAQRTW